MRFGKKLALLILQDERDGRSIRPYISHKIMKQYLAETVREYKEMGASVCFESHLSELRSILHEDIQRIKEYLLGNLEELSASISELFTHGNNLGVSEKGSLRILIVGYKQVRFVFALFVSILGSH